MKFVSTRGGVSPLSFEDALFTGFAEDGGLLVPESIPVIKKEELESWYKLSFQDTFTFMLVTGDEISQHDLKSILHESFKTFSIPDVVRVVKVGDIYLAELFHGPTLAFKDLAMQFVGKILNHFLQLRKKKLSLVIGTSGDTGSAAIQSVKGFETIECFVLYPLGKISALQERQMTTVQSKNIHVLAMKNTNSDGLDEVAKEMFVEKSFKDQYGISSINSINVVRIILQVVHYFYSYLQVTKNVNEYVTFGVPTGAMGNGVAGILAKKMGLPIHKLVLGTNENNTLTNFYATGIFEKWDVDIPTISPAIDIQVPYNFERILYFAMEDSDKATQINKWMNELQKDKKIALPTDLVNKIKETIAIFCVNQNETLEVMANAFKSHSYILDPHSAIGVKGAQLYSASQNDKTPVVCLCTAHPAKFPEAVQQATNVSPSSSSLFPIPPPLQGLMELPEYKVEVDTDDKAAGKLRAMIIQYY